MALRSPRRRGLLRLAIGLLLVSTPLWAPALHLTGDRVTYRATTVEPAPDDPGFAFGTDDVRLRTAFDEVACYGGVDLPRTCALEPVLVNGSPDVTSGERPLYWDARFVYLRGPNEGFYRRTPGASDASTGDEIGLDPVDAATVLATVAVDLDSPRADGVARRAVETGSATVHEDRRVTAAGEVYATDDAYYLVYRAERRTRLVTQDPAAARAVEVVAVLAGVLVLVGGRDLTAEEETRPDGAG